MGSAQWTLNARDFLRGLAVAIGGAVLSSLIVVFGGVINTQGFDLWMVDWGTLWHMTANTAVVAGFGAFTGYLMKNAASDESGKLFGKI